MTIKEALGWAKGLLKGAEVSEPESSALVLLAEVLGMTRTELMARQEQSLTTRQLGLYRRMISRRLKHESVWHILGRVQFRGLEFKVTKDVLVPRPETELLVEHVIQAIRNSKFETRNSPLAILDVGTGSGTIAVTLAREIKNSTVTATDVSAKALAVAKKNAKKNGVAGKIRFVKSDLFSDVTGKFDIICANLPYIPSKDMEGLAIDVHHYEPRLALDGGVGGLEIYERFLGEAGNYLEPKGMVFCEIGINQGDEFKKLVGRYLPQTKIEILGDLAGIDRIAIISLR